MTYEYEEGVPYLTPGELRDAATLLESVNALSKQLVLTKSEIQLAAGVPFIDSSGEYCGAAVYNSDMREFVFQVQEEQ